MTEQPNGIDSSQPSTDDTSTCAAFSFVDDFAIPELPKHRKPKKKPTMALKDTSTRSSKRDRKAKNKEI